MAEQALSAQNWDQFYIAVQHFRYGKEGREKVILFAPSEIHVKHALAKARRLDVKDL